MQNKLKTGAQVARWLIGTSRGFRPQIALNLAIGILHVIFGLAIVWVTKECIDLSVNVAHGTAERNELIISIVSLIALILSDVLLAYAIRWIRALLGIRSRNRLQAEYYHRILHADWQTVHRIHTGDLTSRLTQDVETVSDFLSERLPQLITTLLQLAGAFALLCYLDWHLALIIIILTPALLGIAQIYMHRMRRYKHDIRESEAGIQGFLQETLTHSLMIKALERVDMVDSKLVNKHAHLEELTRRNTHYSANATLLINLTFSIGYLTAFFWGVYRMSTGVITFGAMVAFIQLVGQIQGPIRTLTTYVSTLISVTTAGDRLMALPEELKRENGAKTPEETPSGLSNSIQIKDLSFAYEDGTKVFDDWSATIPLYLSSPAQHSPSPLGESWRGATGATTAIIGHTGIGKTTLVQLLLGVLKPQGGTITLPTHTPNGLPPQGEGRGGASAFSYVPQGNTLLSGTIRENLLYGNPNATDAEMEHALRLADAEFALTPNGLSPQGESWRGASIGERGSGLSEGQAQRVSIARALLKDAQILLFDEAFSALDSDTAVKILTAIRADRPHQTIIFVTHREALIDMADNVIRI